MNSEGIVDSKDHLREAAKLVAAATLVIMEFQLQ